MSPCTVPGEPGRCPPESFSSLVSGVKLSLITGGGRKILGYQAWLSGRTVDGVNVQKRMYTKAKGRLPVMGPEGLWGISGESSLSFL